MPTVKIASHTPEFYMKMDRGVPAYFVFKVGYMSLRDAQVEQFYKEYVLEKPLVGRKTIKLKGGQGKALSTTLVESSKGFYIMSSGRAFPKKRYEKVTATNKPILKVNNTGGRITVNNYYTKVTEEVFISTIVNAYELYNLYKLYHEEGEDAVIKKYKS